MLRHLLTVGLALFKTSNVFLRNTSLTAEHLAGEMRAASVRWLAVVCMCAFWFTGTASSQELWVEQITPLLTAGDDVLLPAGETNSGVVDTSYQDGELKISAHDVPFGDVIRAVCSRLGIELEFADEAAEPRIVAVEGPGRVRDVVSHFLNGMPVDYLMLSNAESPDMLAKLIILNRRPATTPMKAILNDAANTKPERRVETPYAQLEVGIQAQSIPVQPQSSATYAENAPGNAPALHQRVRGRRRSRNGTLNANARVEPNSGAANASVE